MKNLNSKSVLPFPPPPADAFRSTGYPKRVSKKKRVKIYQWILLLLRELRHLDFLLDIPELGEFSLRIAVEKVSSWLLF